MHTEELHKLFSSSYFKMIKSKTILVGTCITDGDIYDKVLSVFFQTRILKTQVMFSLRLKEGHVYRNRTYQLLLQSVLAYFHGIHDTVRDGPRRFGQNRTFNSSQEKQ
jgi:hypothetical protein